MSDNLNALQTAVLVTVCEIPNLAPWAVARLVNKEYELPLVSETQIIETLDQLRQDCLVYEISSSPEWGTRYGPTASGREYVF